MSATITYWFEDNTFSIEGGDGLGGTALVELTAEQVALIPAAAAQAARTPGWAGRAPLYRPVPTPEEQRLIRWANAWSDYLDEVDSLVRHACTAMDAAIARLHADGAADRRLSAPQHDPAPWPILDAILQKIRRLGARGQQPDRILVAPDVYSALLRAPQLPELHTPAPLQGVHTTQLFGHPMKPSSHLAPGTAVIVPAGPFTDYA